MARFLQRRFQMVGKESRFGITNVFKNAAFLRIIIFGDTRIEFDDANIEQQGLVDRRLRHDQLGLLGDNHFIDRTTGACQAHNDGE